MGARRGSALRNCRSRPASCPKAHNYACPCSGSPQHTFARTSRSRHRRRRHPPMEVFQLRHAGLTDPTRASGRTKYIRHQRSAPLPIAPPCREPLRSSVGLGIDLHQIWSAPGAFVGSERAQRLAEPFSPPEAELSTGERGLHCEGDEEMGALPPSPRRGNSFG